MRFAVPLLVLLTVVTLFAGLGRPAITDSDEAFYAEASREMVAGGDWLTPHFNYENRFQKPILFYWIAAACYSVAGISEAAARFGSALTGLGIVLITLACGRRWYDRATGVLAALIVSTSLGAVAAARLSLPDLPLAFFVTLTIWAAFVALFDKDRSARHWWLVASVGAALGFLTKGPLALAVPAIVVAPPFVLERGWRRLRVGDLVLAGVVFVLIAAPWYVAMTREHGTAYLRGFFLGDNVARFATTTFNPHRSAFFYVPIVLAGMFPWSPFFALGLEPAWRALRQRRRPTRPDLRLLSWALLPLLLFTASVGKQPRYILPMLAPLALLLAVGIRRAVTTPPPLPGAQPKLFRWMAALSGGLVIALAGLVWRARPLFFAQAPGRLAAGVLLLCGGGLAVIGIAASRRWRLSTPSIALLAALMVMVLRYAVLAVPGPEPVEQMAGRVVAHRQAGELVASYHVFVRNLVFYTHIQQADLYTDENLVAFLGTPDPVLCVLPQRDLDRLVDASRRPGGEAIAQALAHVQKLESITYFDAATAKIGQLLWPRPERDLQTAVLVRNR